MHGPGIDRARELRRDMPLAERRLWARLRRSALGFRFRRQHPVCGYVADFACVSIKLIVEMDGPSHHAHPREVAYDRQRTATLEANGWTVVRFTNVEVATGLDAVCDAVRIACDEAALRASRSAPI